MENKAIKGITVKGIENILSQFADDTAAFLSCEQIVIDEFTKTLKKVEAEMGLSVSYDKTYYVPCWIPIGIRRGVVHSRKIQMNE